MATLATVADYVRVSRILLQDQAVLQAARYPDSNYVDGLNFALVSAIRLRQDLFINVALQSFTTVDSTAVTMDPMYRMALVYFICGWVQLQDEEDTQDTRAAMFMQRFNQLLTGVA